MTNTVPLIGRIEESAKIDRFLEILHEGSRCLLLVGEVGIGKTTLLNWSRARATNCGFRVLSASPAESEVPLEFAALADLFEEVPVSVFDELPDPQRRAVGVAVFRDELPEEPVDPRTLATAVLGTFRRLATDTPVLLAMDDLPWLDAPSARVLSYVLRRTRDLPFGLVGTVRTEWSRDRAPLVTDQVNADRLERIRLGPMGERDIAELLADRTGSTLVRSTLKRLQGLCRGNPLFALELMEANTAGGADGSGALMSVPKSLRRLVKSRIGHLPPGARDTLLTAALCAEPEFSVIAAAVSDPLQAAESLERIVESGVVVREGDDITFAHPLIRSVVVDETTAGLQRAAHRRLAMTVRHPEERARHLALGANGPSEKIAQEVEDAALAASARGACDTAAALAQMAASLTPSDRARDRHRRMVLEAENRFDSFDPTGAIALLEGVVRAMAPGPGRAEVLWRLARYMTYRGDPIATWTARLTEALEESGDDLTLRCAIIIDLGVAAANVGDSATAIRHAASALELAEMTGDSARLSQLRAGMAFVAFCNGEGVQRDLVDQGLSGPEQPLRLDMELRPRFAIGLVLLMSDDLDGARTLFEEELKRAATEGVETGLPQLLSGLVQTEAWAGNWERAEELATEGYRLAEDSGLSVMIAFIAGARGLMHVYKGRIEEGRRDGEKAWAIGMSMGISTVASSGAQALGLAELSVGNASAVHERLGPISDMALAVGVVEPGLFRFLPEEIEALIRLGDLDAALELLEPFETRSTELGRLWGMATSGRCRGLLFAAGGDLDTASSSLARALEQHAGLAMPFEHGRTLLVAGEVHRRARHKALANTHLQSAVAIFERLGAPLWAERARTEIDRLGLRRANPDSKLTDVETRVADLAATGLTNVQIAAELFMSPRTVEAHLSRIYRKLGVSSRTAMSRAHHAQSSERT